MKKINVFFLFLISYLTLFGQVENYQFSRECLDVKDDWHRIELPLDVYAHLRSDFSDVRIFARSADGQISEAPYMLTQKDDEWKKQKVDFELLNKSFDGKGHYFTFALPEKKTINEIDLKFQQNNFDWKVQLEGSHNQKEWFTILQDYQIISIENERMDYSYSKLEFDKSNYPYYRVLVKGKDKPELRSATIFNIDFEPGIFREYSDFTFEVEELPEKKQTKVLLVFPQPVPITQFEIEVDEEYDFYRKMQTWYKKDSVESELGWSSRYDFLGTSSLNSIEKSIFPIREVWSDELKIRIDNEDNKPLNIEGFKVRGPIHNLVARFDDPSTYHLYYGNPNARKPKYDIARFADKIPESNILLNLGPLRTHQVNEESSKAFFTNVNWLYAIMGVIILILGFFTIRMMKTR